MADLKISELSSLAGADLVAADVVAVVDDSASETKKLTVSDLIANGTTLISDATIPSAKILFAAGAIDTAELAASAVETAKINDSAVTAAKLADNSSVTLVSTLPASGDFVGQVALDTDDSKVYVWSGSAWTSVKGAGSINVVNGSTTGEINIVASTSGDTVTISATLDDTTAAAQFLAGPTGAGGTVGYRAIIGTDLPTATTSAKGGVIVNGNGLTMSGDTITIDNSVTAETSENHLVQYDANGLITSGRAIAAGDIPLATSSVTGAVKPGSGLEVTGAGAINHSNTVTGATAAKVTFDAQGHITASEALAATDIPDLDAAKITTGTLPTARLANDAVTADKLADRSTATIAETTPAGGDFIGQCHLNSITGDYFLWDGNVWQPIGISVGEIVLAGTYDASTNLVATVTAEGTAVGFTVGSALPAASSSNKGHYVIVSEAGTGTSPAPTVALNPPDFLLSTGTAYTEIDVSDTVTAQQASNIQFTAAGNIAATNVQSAIEELDTEKVGSASPTFTGTVALGEDAVITFEGATSNDYETTLTVVDPTADRTVSLPNVTGTLISSGDTGTVTSTMILDGTIANADISSSAEIAVSKLANGTARQLLQTDAAGSGVEFTSNVDVPGTLDVTGAATLDSTLAVTGATTVTGVISADGKVKFPAGTAAAPSFYSGTDTNTGLYFSAADEISVATGGTQRLVVDTSGQVGIGTSSVNANLQVHNSSANATLAINNGTVGSALTDGLTLISATDGSAFIAQRENADLIISTNNTERLRIDSSGRLLVGKSSVTANGIFSQLGKFHIQGNTSSSSGSGIIALTRGEAPGSITNNEDIGVISFAASDSNEFAWIRGQADGGTGTDDYPGRLTFSTTADGASSPTERMRIDSSGRLLVGATSGSYDFEVKKSGAVHGLIGSTNASGALLLLDGDSNGDGSGTDYASIGHNSDGNLVLENRKSASIIFRNTSSSTERMRIDSSGNVGIGETSPGSKLHIQDTMQATANGHNQITITGDDSGTVGESARIYLSAINATNRGCGILSERTSSSNAHALVFQTSSDSAIPAERMRIDSSGTIKVHGQMQFTDGASGNDKGAIQAFGDDFSNGNLRFYSKGSGTLTERLRITSTGAWAIEGASNYGTSGQVLTSNGNDSPTWQDAGGGGSTDLAAVGTYAFCGNYTNEGSPGGTRSGSELRYSNAGAFTGSSGPGTGTWRQMGDQDSTSSSTDRANTLWVRVS